MFNRRWKTFWQLLKTGKTKELIRRIFGLIKSSLNQKTEINYPKWRTKWVELDAVKRKHILKRIENLTDLPSFTIMLEFDNSDEIAFFATLRSVATQLFPNWILIIKNLQKSDHANFEKISSFNDDRIRFLGIAEPETGDWVIELQSGVVLHEAALFAKAISITKNPETLLLYSDHDHVSKTGNFCDPYLKPDWNCDLFTATNYISPFVTCKKELWEQGRANVSNQYDFLLQTTAHLSRQKVIHLPYILASQRVYDSSHLKPPVKRIKHLLPTPPPMVSILIPTRDQGTFLEKCLESLIKKTDYPNFEMILINHETKEPKALKVIAKFATKENFRVIDYCGPFNFAAMVNRAAKIAKGDILLLLNNDTEMRDLLWLKELVSQISRPDVGVAGNLLLFGDETIQHAGVHPGIGGLMGHGHKHLPIDNSGYFNRLNAVHEVAAVTGACLAIRKNIWEELNGMDELNLPVAYNDIDLCLKAREKNLKVIFTPFSRVFHHESISRGVDDAPERNERLRNEISFMRKKWGKFLEYDPAYNPNLEMIKGTFKLSQNPRTSPLSEI